MRLNNAVELLMWQVSDMTWLSGLGAAEIAFQLRMDKDSHP
ncbi:hypothetical protein Q669_12180 [Labrenzia sp. C1B10]|nr:hypothetical protein Q669_12180 [Labrenzia sp. C1B10]ERS07821.1 hypothetical protein Q675_20810 [Labrenzia sp. C1B70]